MWDRNTRAVMHSLTIPRGVCLLPKSLRLFPSRY